MESVSGEEHKATQSKRQHSPSSYTRYLPFVAIALVCSGLSFWAGSVYQKHHSVAPQTIAAAEQDPPFGSMGNGGFGPRMMRGNFGEVTAVNATSITVKQTRTGSTATYEITSNTTVTNDGNSASISDIKSGDTVMIRTDSSDSKKATEIILNPQMPSSGSQTAPQGSTQLQTQ